MPTPVTEQAPWLAQGDEKHQAVKRMFADIAPSYDLINSLLSVRSHRRWRSAAVDCLNLKAGDRALDVCCGTGDFLFPLRKAVGSTGTLVGVDFCRQMLEVGVRKLGNDANLLLGDACNLPFCDGYFNAVSVGWGIRNVPDIDAAHREAFRVLKSGGRFVSLDMAKPTNRLVRWISGPIANILIPLLGSLFGKTKAYRYLPKSTERFLDREQLKISMEQAGFVKVKWRNLLFGNICIHWGEKP